MSSKKSSKKPQVLDEATAASETIVAKPTEATSKSSLMAQGYAAMAAMDASTLESVLAQLGHYGDAIADGTAEKNAGTIQTKPSAASGMQESLQEDLTALFGSYELTEDFKSKMSVIFEAQVQARVIAIEEEIKEAYEMAIDEEVAGVTEALVEQIDKYVTLAAETFIEKNALAIDSSLRAEMVESFLGGLYNLFSEHHVVLPEEKIDVTEALADKVAELEENLNEQIEVSLQLTEALEAYTRKDIFDEVSAGLAASQIDKFRQLAEGVEFKDVDEFKHTLEVLKEHNFAVGSKTAASVVPQEVALFEDAADATSKDTTTKIVDPTVARIASFLSKTSQR